MKKQISALLALMLTLTACGSGAPAETTAAQGGESGETTTSASESARDSLDPTLDFGGETVTLYVDKMCSLPEFDCEQTGDVVEDAVYKRNITVQERLNVVFDFIEAESSWSDNLQSFQDPVRNSIMAGDAAYDIVAGYCVSMGNLAGNLIFTDLGATKHLDFSQPWWPDSLMDDLAVDGKLYFASGDISTNMVGTMFSVLFNKELVADYNIESPYALVDAGKWTLDKFFGLTKDVYTDLNNNGQKDNGDFYGITAQNTSIDNLYYASGMNIVIQDKEAGMKVSPDFGSEKMATLVERLCSYFHDGDSVYLGGEDDHPEATQAFPVFKNSNAIFALSGLKYALQKLRDADFEYGVVPTPKYDESQEKHHTTVAYTGAQYAIPIDAKNIDMSSAVMEALAIEGYYTLSPAFFETAMKVKYTSDDDSARMFDIMKESLSFDFGRIYQSAKLNGIPGKLRNMVTNNDTNWMSTYEGFINELETKLADFVEEIRG